MTERIEATGNVLGTRRVLYAESLEAWLELRQLGGAKTSQARISIAHSSNTRELTTRRIVDHLGIYVNGIKQYTPTHTDPIVPFSRLKQLELLPS